jgi:hypothetical protein
VRLDQALLGDLTIALRSRPVRVFLVIELIAGLVFVMRRGSGVISTVLLIWLGVAILAFFAWWAGRHRLAHPERDPAPNAAARSGFALITVTGMLLWSFEISVAAGFVLFVSGVGGWLWIAWRSDGFRGSWARLTRDVRPFLPLWLLIALPRLLAGGPVFLVGAVLALPSGVGQQLVYLIGLYAPLEAVRGHAGSAAVGAALIFGLLHVPSLIGPNHGDVVAAFANAVLFQASVGIVACLAYQRHRAVVPIGVAHALAIA